MKRYSFIIATLLLFGACGKSTLPDEADGYKPIYENEVGEIEISTTGPAALKNLGRIFYTPSNQYIYLNEINQGIHVIDNSNPKNPVKKHFINIENNTDFYIKGNVLYASITGGIISIDISDITHAKVLGFVNVNSIYPYQQAPPMPANASTGDKVFFECVDSKKGNIVGWKKFKIEKPKCYLKK